jgi:hypothetical protein
MSEEPKVEKLRVRLRDEPGKVPLPSSLRDQLGTTPAPSSGEPVAANRPESRTSRRLWEQPARELLRWLHGGVVEVQSSEAAVLLGDLRAALEDVEVPEQYR